MIKNIFKKKEITYNLEDFMKLNVINELYKGDDNKIFGEITKLLFTSKNINDIPKKEADIIVSNFIATLNERPDFVQKFTIDDVEFGFIPNLDAISVGEYLDLDNYTKAGIDQGNKVMAILYRPITKRMGEKYEIEAYEGTAKYSQLMLRTDYHIYLSSLVFFCNLKMSLLNYLDTSIHKNLIMR